MPLQFSLHTAGSVAALSLYSLTHSLTSALPAGMISLAWLWEDRDLSDVHLRLCTSQAAAEEHQPPCSSTATQAPCHASVPRGVGHSGTNINSIRPATDNPILGASAAQPAAVQTPEPETQPSLGRDKRVADRDGASPAGKAARHADREVSQPTAASGSAE